VAVAEAEAWAGATATALPARASTKWKDVATGRARAALLPLAAQQNSRTVWFHLREKVKDKKFAVEVQDNYMRFEAMGVGRWDRIQQTRKGTCRLPGGTCFPLMRWTAMGATRARTPRFPRL